MIRSLYNLMSCIPIHQPKPNTCLYSNQVHSITIAPTVPVMTHNIPDKDSNELNSQHEQSQSHVSSPSSLSPENTPLRDNSETNAEKLVQHTLTMVDLLSRVQDVIIDKDNLDAWVEDARFYAKQYNMNQKNLDALIVLGTEGEEKFMQHLFNEHNEDGTSVQIGYSKSRELYG